MAATTSGVGDSLLRSRRIDARQKHGTSSWPQRSVQLVWGGGRLGPEARAAPMARCARSLDSRRAKYMTPPRLRDKSRSWGLRTGRSGALASQAAMRGMAELTAKRDAARTQAYACLHTDKHVGNQKGAY